MKFAVGVDVLSDPSIQVSNSSNSSCRLSWTNKCFKMCHTMIHTWEEMILTSETCRLLWQRSSLNASLQTFVLISRITYFYFLGSNIKKTDSNERSTFQVISWLTFCVTSVDAVEHIENGIMQYTIIYRPVLRNWSTRPNFGVSRFKAWIFVWKRKSNDE